MSTRAARQYIRHYAIGGNREAARLAGLRVDILRASTYVIVGGCAALDGAILASLLGVGQADLGGTVALDAIAVVVIGGTSLFGGEGAVWCSGIGLLILAVITNVSDSEGWNANVQSITKGVIIVAAVAIDARAEHGALTGCRAAAGLSGQRCMACGQVRIGSATVCSRCWSDDLRTEALSGAAALYAFTVIRVARRGFQPPYAVGYADLHEGLRVFGHLDDVATARLGQQIEVYRGAVGTDPDGAVLVGTRFTSAAAFADTEQ